MQSRCRNTTATQCTLRYIYSNLNYCFQPLVHSGALYLTVQLFFRMKYISGFRYLYTKNSHKSSRSNFGCARELISFQRFSVLKANKKMWTARKSGNRKCTRFLIKYLFFVFFFLLRNAHLTCLYDTKKSLGLYLTNMHCPATAVSYYSPPCASCM